MGRRHDILYTCGVRACAWGNVKESAELTAKDQQIQLNDNRIRQFVQLTKCANHWHRVNMQTFTAALL